MVGHKSNGPRTTISSRNRWSGWRRMDLSGYLSPLANPNQNEIVNTLRAELYECKSLIDRVLVHFIFKGDVEATENSEGLSYRRENLENKCHLLHSFFGRTDVELTVEFQIQESARTDYAYRLSRWRRIIVTFGVNRRSRIISLTRELFPGATTHAGPVSCILFGKG